MVDKEGPDPFVVDRDPREEVAVGVFRESALDAKPPALCIRQGGNAAGYALIVPELQGERVLTIPAANEADFTYHGNEGTTLSDLGTFVSTAIDEAQADVLRLPLLAHDQAEALRAHLARLLPAWRFDYGLTAVRPTVDKRRDGWRRRNSLWRAYEQASDHGTHIEAVARLPHDEVVDLHWRRWGPNRAAGFFRMLADLIRVGVGRAHTARLDDRSLVAVQVDVTAVRTRYFYYGLNDVERAPGVGNAIMGASWREFVDAEQQVSFSFGRGSERYKYRHANSVDELYELRGFHVPLPRR